MTMIEVEDVVAAMRRVKEFLDLLENADKEQRVKAYDAQREALGLTTDAWFQINRYVVGDVADPDLEEELDYTCVLAFTLALFARQYADERAAT